MNVTFPSRFHSVGASLCFLSKGELAMQSNDTSLIKFSIQHDTWDCTGACRNISKSYFEICLCMTLACSANVLSKFEFYAD